MSDLIDTLRYLDLMAFEDDVKNGGTIPAWVHEVVGRAAGELSNMANRYDDAMKRIQDMQAELEFLRAELARRVE